jgi:endo-1,4-beta-xylanase
MGGGMMGGRGRGGTPPSPEILAQQAEIYKKIFQIFDKNKDVVKRVTFWGISDTRTWRAGQNPLLFDGELKPKPAYEAVLNVGLGK